MMELRTTTCRGCGEQIAFIKTERGKFLPVNTGSVSFVPAGGPNTYVMSDGTVKRGRETDWADRQQANFEVGYICHFATCKAADSFRKR